MYIYVYIHIHIYVYIYVYVYVYTLLLMGGLHSATAVGPGAGRTGSRGVCSTAVILGPGASQGGLGAAGQVALRAIRGIRQIIPRGHCSCAGCVLESHFLGIGRPFLLKTTNCPSADQVDFHGMPRHPKVV